MNQTVLSYLNSLRPAIPVSQEQKGKEMSGSELRRCIEQGAVLINGERCSVKELVDFPVFSLVFFPKSPTKRTTII